MIVTKVHLGAATLLLMGDAEKSLEYRLLASGGNLQSDILKVGHHGSKTSSTQEFLASVSPHYAIISSGKKNRFGHPHQEVLDRLNEAAISLFRTDEDGDVAFVHDGKKFVRVEK